YLAGGQVTETIKNGIVDAELIPPDLFILGMMSSLLAAGTWLFIASVRGWPVSTTHSIVGAVIGFAAVGISADAVHWGAIGPIVGSGVVTPCVAGVRAFGLVMRVQALIMITDNPFMTAKRFVPVYMFLAGLMVSLRTFTKGLKHVGIDLATPQSLLLSIAMGVVVELLGMALLARIKDDEEADRAFHFSNVEKVFAVMMILTACAMVLAHCDNDVD